MVDLTENEDRERSVLIDLQSDHSRWFTREEFDRLQKLNKKLFLNSGSPHDPGDGPWNLRKTPEEENGE